MKLLLQKSKFFCSSVSVERSARSCSSCTTLATFGRLITFDAFDAPNVLTEVLGFLVSFNFRDGCRAFALVLLAPLELMDVPKPSKPLIVPTFPNPELLKPKPILKPVVVV